MGYYGRRRYRSWRSRGWGHSPPSKYSILTGLFGSAVSQIRHAFENLEEDALDELFSDYGAIHGESAERYARKTYPKWKSRSTKLSGQTMERLVELVPPYLSAEQRFSILQSLLKQYKKSGSFRTVKINVKEPALGFAELKDALVQMRHEDVLAHLPESVMKAATWLYDDDITVARSMLADAERLENNMVRAKAEKEIDLLKRTISTGQVQAANYSVEMPAGKLHVVAFTPSKCFVATACFGSEAVETNALRRWRDSYLTERQWGREFIVWYYVNGDRLVSTLSNSPCVLGVVKSLLRIATWVLRKNEVWGSKK